MSSIHRTQRGFTVIELLTVIAIIGVLAALIFPVVQSSRKRAKETQCIHNMMQIWTALKLFQQDEHRYPDFIAGPVDPQNPVPLEQSSGMINGRAMSLYPEYIKDVIALRCPLSILNGDRREYGTDPTQQNTLEDPLAGLRPSAGGAAYVLYKYSSYDFQKPRFQEDGGDDSKAEIHYSTIWSDDMSDPDVAARQLRWRSPPSDTVVTWCSFHRDTDGEGTPSESSHELVLFLDGHVKPRSTEAIYAPTIGDWRNVWNNAHP